MATDTELDRHDSTSRSSSPIAPPPTPSAPGPRATALQKLYHDAITHILKTCNHSNFSSCFPTPARQVPGSVKLLHEQFTAKLGESMRKEFDAILGERNVVASLNELDRLLDEAKRRKAVAGRDGLAEPVPAHTWPARHLYLAHLAPTLATYAQNTAERLEALARENEAAMDRIRLQRSHIHRLLAGLEDVVRDLNGSVSALRPEEMDELRAEARRVDELVRAS